MVENAIESPKMQVLSYKFSDFLKQKGLFSEFFDIFVTIR